MLSGEARPQYVKCPGRLMHRVLTSTCTVCGWPWRDAGGTPVLDGPAASSEGRCEGWCKKCLAGAYAGGRASRRKP